MTTSPSTVPVGKAMAEGNSRQRTPGRGDRECGSAAVRHIKHGLRVALYLPKLPYEDLHNAKKVWLTKVIFCLPKTQKMIHAKHEMQ